MVRLDPGGTVTVIPGSISHGQGARSYGSLGTSNDDEREIKSAAEPS
jgi:hypothetical protein